jgi:PAS domain S-box-containing protein
MQNGSDKADLSSLDRSLFADRVHRVYEHTPLGVTATVMNAAIMALILSDLVPLRKLYIWLACAVGVSALRLVLHQRYHHCLTQYSNPGKWYRLFVASVALAGTVWGSVAVFLFPVHSLGHQAFIAFVAGGMVAGAAGVYSAVLAGFFVFSIPAMLPIAIRFLMLGGDIPVAMGGMLLLFLLIISLVAFQTHRDMGNLLALKYERMALVSDLQQEVARRGAAQEDLRRQKEQVEKIVAQRTAQLDDTNQRLRAILNYAPLAFWAIDREGGLTFCEGKGLDGIGLTPGMVGRSVFDLYAEESPLNHITQGVLAGKFISDTIQFKDAYFEVRFQPVRDGGDGLMGAIGVAIDVTAQTLAREALRRSEEKYRDLVENINDVLYAADPQGMITYISPVVESVLGYRADEIMGTCLFDYVHPQDLLPLQNYFARAQKECEGTGDFRFQGKNGDVKWCRVSCRPMRGDDQNSGIQGVLVDISWSKRLEEHLQRAQKMEALGTLAGGVAHDLNNILSGIVSYPDLLLMDLPQDSPLRRPLSTIKKSGENAAAIVQDLLTLARRGVFMRKILNLNEIVLECIDSPEIRALIRPASHIRLATSLAPNLFNIRGSAIHIHKSLTNLISNAVEAISGGGCIEIRTENRFVDRPLSGFETIREGEYVVLSIEDTGVGIPESDQARIFEPFHTSKVMGRSGSGLGMAVVWGTVKDHNGYLDLQSRQGHGTRFELYFPASREEVPQSPRREDVTELMGHGEFILVVDDMPVQREIATGILSRLGYRVESLASGEEAVEFLRGQAADLVILDMIMLPGMDGYETYLRIKDIRPDQRAIIASGYSESDRVRKALSLGAGRYLKKPYQLAELGVAVQEALEGN